MSDERKALSTLLARVGSPFALPVFDECVAALRRLPARCVDMVFADPPYGITVAAWDQGFNAHAMMAELFRVTKPTGAIVVTANQPFSSMLVAKHHRSYRCEWIWDKVNPTNFANAKRQPLRQHEQVLVFSEKPHVYTPQMTEGRPNNAWKTRSMPGTQVYAQKAKPAYVKTTKKYPKSILTFAKHSSQFKLHPTQKPLGLVRYMLRTYSKPGDIVLDPCLGSGTTLVAALCEGRYAFGFENDQKFFDVTRTRLKRWRDEMEEEK